MVVNTLLLIDVQKDFHPGGSLSIGTADTDACRIASFIRRSINDPTCPKFHRIIATLDSHHKLHIAHPKFWISGEDQLSHPQTFTIITSRDIEASIWLPRSDLRLPLHTNEDTTSADFLTNAGGIDLNQYRGEEGSFDLVKYCIDYTRKLEEKGRFQLCIWPEHCLIATEGHCVVDCVREAMDEWSCSTGASIEWVLKGQNLLTEMYSCLSAEVPISRDTALNYELLESIRASDRIFVAGQAQSHCVNYTVRDLLDNIKADESHKISILTDCMSCVPGFDREGQEFLHYAHEKGAILCTSKDLEI